MKDNAWEKTDEKVEIPGKLYCDIHVNMCAYMLFSNFVLYPLVLQDPFLVTVKVKFNLEEDHEGAEVRLNSCLNLGTGRRWVANVALRPLYPPERETVPTV